MRQIRYIVAIGFYLSVGSVGLLLAGFGGYVVLEYAFNAASAALWPTGPTLWFGPLQLLQYLGFWALMAAIGIGLSAFAWIGSVRRVQLGLPSDDEGVGTSPVRRLLLGSLSAVLFIYAAWTLALGIMLSGPTAINVLTGTKVEANVVGFASLDAEERWLVEYQFTVNGHTYEGAAKYKGDMRYPPSIKGVEVTYETSNPAHFEVTSGYSLWEFSLFVMSRGMLSLVGLWGFWRNVVRGRPTHNLPPPMPVSFTSTRRVFGRRT
jgi:hypothetical protein